MNIPLITLSLFLLAGAGIITGNDLWADIKDYWLHLGPSGTLLIVASVIGAMGLVDHFMGVGI